MFFQISGRLGNRLFQWAYCHVLFDEYGVEPTFFLDKFHHQLKSEKNGFTDLPNCAHHISPIIRNDLGLLIKSMDYFQKYRGKSDTVSFAGIFRSLDSFIIPTLPPQKPFIVTGFYINKSIVEKFEDCLSEEIALHLNSVFEPLELPSTYQVAHVRRGDFITTASSYGTLTAEYYKRNVSEDTPLVMCVDSLEECEDVIRELEPAFILSARNSTPWQAIKVISNASRVILSNSTLSWWGGFLASKRGSKVIIPRPFYKDASELNEVFEFRLFSPEPSLFVGKPNL